jgi:Ca2+-transporting ATPase
VSPGASWAEPASAETTDAGFIAVVLAINAAIGGHQEWKAEQSSRALERLLHIRAAVLRDDEIRELDAEMVVPGDIVWLESGNRVPSDMRLLSTHGLEIDESLLTGESLPVLKEPAFVSAVQTPVADRRNMAHAGSIVVRGRGKGVVIATGANTHVGQLAKDVLEATGAQPPLLLRMARFSCVVALIVLAASVVIGVLGVIVRGYAASEMFLFAVALAVSAIPEGLPVALSVTLAIATTRMARRSVIVRRLAAVEGLGSCTLIASDKTGTLTCNELTVRQLLLPSGDHVEATGEGYAPLGQVLLGGLPPDPLKHEDLARLARAAALCNEADLHLRNAQWVWHGDPTDIALLSLAHKLGWNRPHTVDQHPQVNQIPFEPERRFSATYHRGNPGTEVFVKGAPERVLAMCNQTAAAMRALLDQAEAMAANGYRVLALAEGHLADEVTAAQTPPEPSGLTFLGFVGMIDPLRPGVVEAVAACHRAGLQVYMVTGDHPITALAISRQLGLATQPDQVVAGPDLQDLSPEELKSTVRRARVFARVTPRQKLELVNAARALGHFVAVTGDGVNDAPALRASHIGVAMGKGGTDVAREAADLVLSDDNFASIVAGVEEGRVAFDNVRKVIYLLISTGAAEVFLVGAAVASGLPLPLLPVQLLWLNLVTNGIQDVALAFEPGEGRVLERKPRSPSEPIFNRLMIERTLVAAVVMAGVGFGTFHWLLRAGWSEPSARNALLLLMVLFENVHIGNCRSESKSAFLLSPLRSPILLCGALAAFLLHVSSLYLPLGSAVLKTEPVSLATWVPLIVLSLSILLAMELHKWTWAIRHRQ